MSKSARVLILGLKVPASVSAGGAFARMGAHGATLTRAAAVALVGWQSAARAGAWIVVLAVAVAALRPIPARALDRDVKAVILTSLYGAVAGTVLGAASYPFSQSVRGIFMGTSIGLYLGAAAGTYHVYHRDDPENPLSQRYRPGVESLPSRLDDGTDYRESGRPFGDPQKDPYSPSDGWRELSPGKKPGAFLDREQDLRAKALVYIQVPVLEF